MRVDKFFTVSGLIKRRTVAIVAGDAGGVTINGRVVKAGAEVKAGDVLTVAFGERTLRVEVVSVDEHASKADAPAMYREI